MRKEPPVHTLTACPAGTLCQAFGPTSRCRRSASAAGLESDLELSCAPSSIDPLSIAWNTTERTQRLNIDKVSLEIASAHRSKPHATALSHGDVRLGRLPHPPGRRCRPRRRRIHIVSNSPPPPNNVALTDRPDTSNTAPANSASHLQVSTHSQNAATSPPTTAHPRPHPEGSRDGSAIRLILSAAVGEGEQLVGRTRATVLEARGGTATGVSDEASARWIPMKRGMRA